MEIFPHLKYKLILQRRPVLVVTPDLGKKFFKNCVSKPELHYKMDLFIYKRARIAQFSFSQIVCNVYANLYISFFFNGIKQENLGTTNGGVLE